MTKLFIALYRFFSGHKAVFWTVLLSSTAVFAFFATKIQFEENILDLLPKTEKAKQCAVAFGDIKLKDKVIIQLVPTGENSVPRELCDAMDEFVQMLEKKDGGNFIKGYLYRFDQDDMMNFLYYGMGALPNHLNEPIYCQIDSLLEEENFDRLVSDISNGKRTLPAVGPFTMIDRHLFSSDSTVALCFATPSFEAMDTKAGTDLELLLSSCTRDFHKSHPDFEVLYHGNSVEASFNSLQCKKDLFKTIGLSLLVICILLGIAFKSVRSLVHLTAPVVYGILFAMAAVYFIQGSISLIALGIGAIVMGVAMSYCLHVITHQKFVCDVETVLKEQVRPVCLGCLTTIGAFAGLLLTTSELLRDFGIFASLALVGTTFFVLAFLPQMLGAGTTVKNEKVFSAVNKINTYPIDRNKPVIAVLSILAFVCILESGKVRFDTDLGNIGYREPKVIRSDSLYNEKVYDGHYCQYYAAYCKDLDSAIILSRSFVPTFESLKSQGEIYDYSSPDMFLVPLDVQQQNIQRWKNYWTSQKAQKAYLLLKKEAEKNNWPSDEIDIPDSFKTLVEADFQAQSIIDSGILPDYLTGNFVEATDDGWMVFQSALMDRQRLHQVDDMVVKNSDRIIVLDPFYYAGDMVKIAHSDFQTVLLISSIFVFIVLLLSFKSLIISLIAFFPMMTSWYVVQGIMAFFGIDFNIMNIMISSFIFGIGVDYSIFVMEGLLSNSRSKSYRLLLCHKAAIFFSALTLIIFTGSLLFAVHPALYSIGACTLIGMSSTILLTYAIEPLLFKLAMKCPVMKNKKNI